MGLIYCIINTITESFHFLLFLFSTEVPSIVVIMTITTGKSNLAKLKQLSHFNYVNKPINFRSYSHALSCMNMLLVCKVVVCILFPLIARLLA